MVRLAVYVLSYFCEPAPPKKLPKWARPGHVAHAHSRPRATGVPEQGQRWRASGLSPPGAGSTLAPGQSAFVCRIFAAEDHFKPFRCDIKSGESRESGPFSKNALFLAAASREAHLSLLRSPAFVRFAGPRLVGRSAALGGWDLEGPAPGPPGAVTSAPGILPKWLEIQPELPARKLLLKTCWELA